MPRCEKQLRAAQVAALTRGHGLSPPRSLIQLEVAPSDHFVQTLFHQSSFPSNTIVSVFKIELDQGRRGKVGGPGEQGTSLPSPSQLCAPSALRAKIKLPRRLVRDPVLL